jgi:hypothetical protein
MAALKYLEMIWYETYSITIFIGALIAKMIGMGKL